MPDIFSLPSELTIYTVATLHPQCRAWLESAGQDDDTEPWQVDAAAVDEVDAAGLQLLQSLANAVALRRRRLDVLNPPACLSGACADLGVAALLAPATPDVSLAAS
jgi:ABC-type transporter Mla MlaB component